MFPQRPELISTNCLNVTTSIALCNKLASSNIFPLGTPQIYLFVCLFVPFQKLESLTWAGDVLFSKAKIKRLLDLQGCVRSQRQRVKYGDFWENPIYRAPCPGSVTPQHCNPQGSSRRGSVPRTEESTASPSPALVDSNRSQGWVIRSHPACSVTWESESSRNHSKWSLQSPPVTRESPRWALGVF